jgi:hypothetical protein
MIKVLEKQRVPEPIKLISTSLDLYFVPRIYINNKKFCSAITQIYLYSRKLGHILLEAD